VASAFGKNFSWGGAFICKAKEKEEARAYSGKSSPGPPATEKGEKRKKSLSGGGKGKAARQQPDQQGERILQKKSRHTLKTTREKIPKIVGKLSRWVQKGGKIIKVEGPPYQRGPGETSYTQLKGGLFKSTQELSIRAEENSPISWESSFDEGGGCNLADHELTNLPLSLE